MPAGETIQSILDILRTDPGVGGDAQRIGQLAWMLFLKLLDASEIRKEMAPKDYRSPIPNELRWESWAPDPGRTGDELLAFVNGTLLPGLQHLPGADPLSRVVRDALDESYNYVKSGAVLRQVVNALNAFDFYIPADRLEFGRIYEQLLGELRGAGNTGEYYTPRAVTQFMVEQVDPRPGEIVRDPACGTGGFLACAIEHLRDKSPVRGIDEEMLPLFIQGVEKRQLPYLLCVTNMILHGIDVPHEIQRSNALGQETTGYYSPMNDVDVFLTNPPFGGVEEDGIERNFPAAFRTRETADLFLYLVMTQLRSGGRAAIVVPDGLLFGAGVKKRLKEKLLDECNLHTIVRLPKGVFSPYTSIGTNLLFFTKGEPTKNIWYYEHPYPPGYTSYTKSRPLHFEEFAAERAWWRDRRATRQAWKVSVEEIRARDYNLDLRRIAADAGQAPTRLSSLQLHGFRGFGSLDLTLPKEGPAVLIGVNGAGKSTVLEAIAILLSSFTALASGLDAQQAEIRLGEGDIKDGARGATVSATLRVGEREQRWERFVSGPRVAAPSDNEIAQAQRLRDQLLRFETASVPVLCFYPATRRISDGADGVRASAANAFPQLEAYDLAFGQGLGPFQEFLHWFLQEENIENEVRLRRDADHRNPRLQVVRRAVERFLSALGAGRFTDLRMERFSSDTPSRVAKPAVLVLEKDGVHLGLDQLSEGERGTILLVSDLARRFAEANPAREDPLQGEGIVLIDDLERDLHPGWQRAFLPALCGTFPGCQFIVSTHSPQVLSQAHKENVFILENFELVQVTPHTYGHDANSILGEVMGLSERPLEIEEKIRQASILLDEERLEEAKSALKELVSILGDHDAVIVRLSTLVSFLEDDR